MMLATSAMCEIDVLRMLDGRFPENSAIEIKNQQLRWHPMGGELHSTSHTRGDLSSEAFDQRCP